MKSKKKRRNKKKKMNKKMLLILWVIAFFLIIKAITGIFSNDNNIKETLLLDNELISLKNDIYIDEDKVIYLSKEDVENIFDPTIYYNDAEKELITTYNKHIALLKIDADFMVVNDSNVELESPLIERNKKVYIPFSEMDLVYDLEIEYSENTKKVIADSTSKEKKKSLTLRKMNVKERPTIFSGTVEKIENGRYVTIVEEGEKYTKIRTPDGNIGYLKTKRISDYETVRENLSSQEVNPNILKNASNLSKNYKIASLNKDKTNVVIPEFFYLDEKGSVLDKTGSLAEEFITYKNWAKDKNIEIWATLSNNIEVSNSLRTYTDRNSVINSLYYHLVNHQFEGININFKKIDDVNSFNRFIIELTPRLKELGIKVAVTYNKNVDKEKLNKIVDYIIE